MDLDGDASHTAPRHILAEVGWHWRSDCEWDIGPSGLRGYRDVFCRDLAVVRAIYQCKLTD
jgi:hypothetical protein